jgi:hypothetical protein
MITYKNQLTVAQSFLFNASGVTENTPSEYRFTGSYNGPTGSFSGSYFVNVPKIGERGVYRRAAKRLWDLKLRWGSGPNVPRSIIEIAGDELIIESHTISSLSGEDGPTTAIVYRTDNLMVADLRYKELEPIVGAGGSTQTSFSSFWGDGPGRVRFETSHQDDLGEFAVTRGVIVLKGNPKAEMPKRVFTRFTIDFEKPENVQEDEFLLTGGFKGKVELTDYRLDLPYDPREKLSNLKNEIVTDLLELEYEIQDEINTAFINFRKLPSAEKLPMTIEAPKKDLVVHLRPTVAGGLHISGVYDRQASLCNHSWCNLSQTGCVHNWFWDCSCVTVNFPAPGTTSCTHKPCSYGSGNVGPASTDFSIEIGPGEW